MSEENNEINEIKRITADEEYKLEVNGFKCPDSYVTQFTPLEFEEVTILFLLIFFHFFSLHSFVFLSS